MEHFPTEYIPQTAQGVVYHQADLCALRQERLDDECVVIVSEKRHLSGTFHAHVQVF